MSIKHKRADRDGAGFVALPHTVLDSPAFLGLSFSARALLIDIARQFSGSNNGRLVACEKAMKPRGWTSHATITKGLRELLDAGLLCITRQGCRPNRATWLALTWHGLDWTPDMEIARNGFTRGAYLLKKS